MTVQAYDIAQVVEDGQFKPFGSWSEPCIYVRRTWSNSQKEAALDRWSFSINHSSSSSCTYNVDALLKTSLMALQLTDCIDTLRDMMNRVDEFEAAWEANKFAAKAEAEKAAAEAQAKIDADTFIGVRQAAHLVATWVVDVQQAGCWFNARHKVRVRGEETWLVVEISKTSRGAAQFKLQHSVIPRAKLITRLADFAEIQTEK